MKIDSLATFNNINYIDFGEKILVFKFGGDWCVPCMELNKNLEKIENILVYEISIDEPDFESYLIDNKIYKIPHCICKYKNKKSQFKGVKTVDELQEFFDDMRK